MSCGNVSGMYGCLEDSCFFGFYRCSLFNGLMALWFDGLLV